MSVPCPLVVHTLLGIASASFGGAIMPRNSTAIAPGSRDRDDSGRSISARHRIRGLLVSALGVATVAASFAILSPAGTTNNLALNSGNSQAAGCWVRAYKPHVVKINGFNHVNGVAQSNCGGMHIHLQLSLPNTSKVTTYRGARGFCAHTWVRTQALTAWGGWSYSNWEWCPMGYLA